MDESQTIQSQSVENTNAGAVKATSEVKDKPAEAIKHDGTPDRRTKEKNNCENDAQAFQEQRAECPMAKTKPANERVCEICGHVNKGNAIICEMCSNYLID